MAQMQAGLQVSYRVVCIRCKQKTNHHVLGSHTQSETTPDGSITSWETNQLIQCLGCGTPSFRRLIGSSEDLDPETGEELVTEELYPSRTAGREPMEGYNWFPPKTLRVYNEVLKALNYNAPVLATIGLRALIESICLEQGTRSRNLHRSIKELVSLGLLSNAQGEFLDAHRFLGNMAAHEMVAPKPQELLAALDIAETLLKTIYILPHIAASIRSGNTSGSPQS